MGTVANECCNTGAGCQRLKWTRRCVSYAVDLRGSRDLGLASVETIAEQSFKAWTDIGCGAEPQFEVRREGEPATCTTAEYNDDDGNVNVIAFVLDWEARENDPRAYALTTVWHNVRTGEIYDADMEFNEDRGPYGVCPDLTGCSDGTVDLQNVMTHEAGHFFGMGHTDVPSASMFPMSPPGEVTRRVVRSDDTDGFCDLYPAGSLPEACDFEPRGGLELVCEGGCACSVPGGPRAGDIAFGSLLAIAVSVVVRRRRRHPPAR
jgi:MYXO-CTERM domain-containing protein